MNGMGGRKNIGLCGEEVLGKGNRDCALMRVTEKKSI